MLSMLSYVVVTIQWVLFGFSLSFAEDGSALMGTFTMGGMTGVGSQAMPLTAPQVSAITFALFQLQFATVTVAIIVRLSFTNYSLVLLLKELKSCRL